MSRHNRSRTTTTLPVQAPAAASTRAGVHSRNLSFNEVRVSYTSPFWSQDEDGDIESEDENLNADLRTFEAIALTLPASPSLTPSLTRPAAAVRQRSSHRSLAHKLSSWKQPPPPIIDTTLSPPPSPRLPTHSSPCSDSNTDVDDFIPTLTGDKHSQIRLQDRSGMASWFKGSSAPVSLGMAIKGDSLEHSTLTSLPNRSAARLQKAALAQTTTKQSPPASKKFSFFGAKATLPKVAPTAAEDDDEFFNMDITTALFPVGRPDPMSPSSFRNLQDNSEALFLRMQTAYRLRTLSLQEAATEKCALQDEKDKSDARANLLKVQLEDTRSRVSEQESTIKELIDELVQERRRRHDEEEARKKSIALVRDRKPAALDVSPKTPSPVNRFPRKRVSNLTIASDSGFESEEDSMAESVFSRPRASSMSSSSTQHSSPDSLTGPPTLAPGSFRVAQLKTDASEQVPTIRPPLPQRLSTFQKVLNGIPTEPDPLRASELKTAAGSRSTCANCSGASTSKAWSAVSLLRSENRGLKERVIQLEGAVDCCLDFVGGIKA
ncbi:MAG: hypothetical protein M1825_001024 [Sarcosagium campestre]|nr:MAG: hypothetical protein M1825_001024 [Sarcosagium campestre]